MRSTMMSSCLLTVLSGGLAAAVLIPKTAAAEEPAESALTGTIVTLEFSGTGTGAHVGKTFSGVVKYDQSKGGTAGIFPFGGSVKQHVFNYTINAGTPVNTPDCDPFTLTTKTSGTAANNTKLKFNAAVPAMNGVGETTADIVFPTELSIYSSPTITALPLCKRVVGGVTKAVFVASPAAGTATFTLSGGTTFTGDITCVKCSP